MWLYIYMYDIKKSLFFPPRYLTENFALRHLIEAYETQLAEKRMTVMTPSTSNM